MMGPADGSGLRSGSSAAGSASSSGDHSDAPIRVVTADDQRIVREGLAMLLSLLPRVEVVGIAADGAEALDLAEQHRPDVVLMDLRMPGIDGIAATRRLRAQLPDVRIVVLTTYADDQSVVEALRAGAVGYLTKDASAVEIQQALERVRSGQAVIDPAVQRSLVDAIAANPPTGEDGQGEDATTVIDADPGKSNRIGETKLPDGLTPREAEVLSLIGAGLSNAEIASRLVVTEATVKSHINHLFPKIHARDRAQAVRYAYQHGLAP